MKEELLNKKYIDITHLIQREFDRNIQKYGSKIKCAKGCSQCCYQIFNITPLDAHIIKNYVNSLPIIEKESLKQKAEIYKTNFDSSQEHPEKTKLPCPALNKDGECTIYEARPIICRRFGALIYDYKKPGKLFACELNFQNDEEIFDEELIPNQTEIGMRWDDLKTKFNNRFNGNKSSTTIAEAILNS